MSALSAWKSSLTPAATFSNSPLLPFFPFVLLGLFSSAMMSPELLPSYTPVKNAPGSLNLLGCPFGHEYSFEVSTRICPSGASSTCARSIGRGAGPSKLIPSLSYPLPWHGHLNLFSLGFQSGVQPKCVQRA